MPWTTLRDLYVDLDAGERWTLSVPGDARTVDPPELGPEGRALRMYACTSVRCDAHGVVDPEHQATWAALRALAAEVGDRLAALLPPSALALLERRLAGRTPPALRLQVRGTGQEAALALPWPTFAHW